MIYLLPLSSLILIEYYSFINSLSSSFFYSFVYLQILAVYLLLSLIFKYIENPQYYVSPPKPHHYSTTPLQGSLLTVLNPVSIMNPVNIVFGVCLVLGMGWLLYKNWEQNKLEEKFAAVLEIENNLLNQIVTYQEDWINEYTNFYTRLRNASDFNTNRQAYYNEFEEMKNQFSQFRITLHLAWCDLRKGSPHLDLHSALWHIDNNFIHEFEPFVRYRQIFDQMIENSNRILSFERDIIALLDS
uniref:Uncharacterized protein n=1 Tax=Orbilia oligospora TaxID=2813651 RepID=A0A6G6A529_ORBOL|nr:hypothetical protein [Orbilia oligospora]